MPELRASLTAGSQEGWVEWHNGQKSISNLLQRDAILVGTPRQQALDQDLPVDEVDGQIDLKETAVFL